MLFKNELPMPKLYGYKIFFLKSPVNFPDIPDF